MRPVSTSTSLKYQVNVLLLSRQIQDDLHQHVDNGLGGNPHVFTLSWLHPHLALQFLPFCSHMATHLPLRLFLLPGKPALPFKQEVPLPSQRNLRKNFDNQQTTALSLQADGGDGGGK